MTSLWTCTAKALPLGNLQHNCSNTAARAKGLHDLRMDWRVASFRCGFNPHGLNAYAVGVMTGGCKLFAVIGRPSFRFALSAFKKQCPALLQPASVRRHIIAFAKGEWT